MPETISCPSCRRRLVLPDEILGRPVRCPACLTTFRAEVPPPTAHPVDDIPVAEIVDPPPQRTPWNDLDEEGSAVPKRRKRKTSRWLVGGILAGVALLVLGVGLAVVGIIGASAKRHRTAVKETPEQRRQVLRTAFSRPVAVEKPDPALTALFNDLGQALQRKDRARIQALFDGERLFDEVVDQGMDLPRGPRSRQAFSEGFSRGLSNDIFELAWTSFEIRNIAWRGDKEAAVIVRHRQADGDELKMRWFLTRESGSWKVYDFEDLRVGMRMSTTAALMGKEGLANVQAVGRAARDVRDAGKAITQGDLDRAEPLLRQALAVQIPNSMRALAFVLQANIHLLRGQAKEALESLQRAEQAYPDMPLIDLSRGVAYNHLGEWDKALKHLKAYQELLGDEENVCLQLGEALRGKERFAEAAAAYRKSLDINPKNLDSFLGLMYSLTSKDRRDDVPDRFARLDNRQEAFRTCVEALQQASCDDAVEQLAEVMHGLEPGYTPAAYQLCLARVRAGQWQKAVQLFRSHLAGEKEPLARREHLTGFLQAMAQAGKPLEAYAAAPEPREAFAILAAELKKSSPHQQLEDLVQLHRTKAANDSLLPFYQAELLVQEGKYAEADRAFAAAVKRPPDRATLDLFRSSRVLARYHTDRPLSAYDDIGPRQETFEQLAQLLLTDNKHELLEKLLATHSRSHPDDPQIPRFRMRARIRQGKVAEGVALFKAELARPLNKEQREPLVSLFLQEMLSAGHSLEAYQAAPDPVYAFRFLAENLIDEEYDDMAALEKLVAAHRRAPNLDQENAALLSLYEAEVLAGKKQWARAVHFFETSWPLADEEAQSSFRHRYVYALYQDKRVRQAYEKVPPRNETFEQLANLLLQDKKGKDLEELIALHRPSAGDDPVVDSFAARAKVLLGRYEEAGKLLARACKKQPVENQRQDYVRQFCWAMAAAGKPLDAYRAAPDRQTAFATLASSLLGQKKAAELKALVDEHGKVGAKDRVTLRYRAELALLEGEPARAEKLFTEALAVTPDNEQWALRNGLSRTRIRAGKTVAVYEQSGSKSEVFEELGQVCIQEKDGKQLAALVAAHRRAHPRDPSLPIWDLDVKWLEKDYQGVCKLVAEHRPGLFDQARYCWKVDDYLVRSLVKLGRSAEAVREVEALARQGRHYPLGALLAHAAHGGAPEAIAAMEKASEERPDVESCYLDPDLGPLLRSEAFAAFRKKFPQAGTTP